MKKLFFIVVLFLSAAPIFAREKSFYDFTVKAISGEDFPLSSLRGKKVLVVNVASKCGLTPQYAQLQELYERYGPEKFVIIAFPANNFMRQEPGTNQEIRDFCRVNYGVTFLLMEKISVKGKDMHPLYEWLTKKCENGKEDAEVKWNFQKFMIDEDGNWAGVAEPKTLPEAKEITDWIEGGSSE
jgi:glutathione peroxidase